MEVIKIEESMESALESMELLYVVKNLPNDDQYRTAKRVLLEKVDQDLFEIHAALSDLKEQIE